jgi:hypothetical protein
MHSKMGILTKQEHRTRKPGRILPPQIKHKEHRTNPNPFEDSVVL